MRVWQKGADEAPIINGGMRYHTPKIIKYQVQSTTRHPNRHESSRTIRPTTNAGTKHVEKRHLFHSAWDVRARAGGKVTTYGT